LWATILELITQSSLDTGSLLAISPEGYDTLPPSNIDDDSLDSDISKPKHVLTQSSFQILLMDTMRVRIKIARLINDFKPFTLPAYETALNLSSELTNILTSCDTLIEGYHMSSRPPTPFQTQFFKISTQRFMLALHAPFARQTSPSYHYSRKLCIETAMELLETCSGQNAGDDFNRLQMRSAGHVRSVYRECALVLTGEMLRPDPYQSVALDPGSRFHEKTRDIVQKYLEIAEARMRGGDKSFKCYVLLCCFLAKANALTAEVDVESSVGQEFRRAMERCHAALSLNVPESRPSSEASPEASLTACDQYGWAEWRSFSVS
jgi:hypothetical protein